MIAPNPVFGTGLHAVGGISASTCYLPFSQVRRWTWESYWLVQSFFAWLIMPLLIGFFTVPELISVFRDSPPEAIIFPFLLGAVYGFGGMSFGYAIQHIGFSLTYTISIGISAVLGTITPLILDGTLAERFLTPGGSIVLAGMILSILGIVICGSAGYMKERDIEKLTGKKELQKFNMKKGLTLTLIAGILSAVFGISLSYAQPVSDVASIYGAGHFEGNAKIIIPTAGCFVTNLIWFLVKGIRQGSLGELFHTGGRKEKSLLPNYLLAILGGSLWYFQFFFYGLGHVRMGNFMFASWGIHMTMLIFFSYLVGLIMKEWKEVRKSTYRTLLVALLMLVLSFAVITYGTVKGQEATKESSASLKKEATSIPCASYGEI